MADEIDEDHLIQLGKSDFITDEQYQALHAKKVWERDHPMADEIDDDHLLQTQIQFINDAQWQYISHDYLMTQNQGNDFMSDDEYRAFHAFKAEQNYNAKHMPDWIEDDHLVQTNQRWVELPDCASAADASRPLTGTVEDGHNGSSATCKTGTHW